ncbi:MAG TPA: sulfite exporter TauE/SafE family protein [Capsulimonadaceae bacterium]|jgi:ABC-type nickel/cobalt efflux system permease component RcnA
MNNIKVTSLVATVLIFLVVGGRSFAHPMGNISINHYSRLTVSSGTVAIRYVLDYAEIPTVSERQAMGAAASGAVDGEALARYQKSAVPNLLANLSLTANGVPVALVERASDITFKPGAGALPTMRLVADFEGTLPSGAAKLAYRDGNYATRVGWKEIVVAAGDGASVSNAAVLGRDASRELTVYPRDLLSATPQMTQVEFAVGPPGAVFPAAASVAAVDASSGAGISETPRDRFTQAITSKKLTLPVVLLGLLIAFVYGGLHAMSPGHGKTMVAAYLVGQRGTVKHAMLLGGVVTLTHTFGVFLLGFITLFASKYIVPERLFPVLSVISGLAVFGVGVWLLVSRLRGNESGHDHSHDHLHEHDHAHEHEHEHAHTVEKVRAHSRSLVAGQQLALAGGNGAELSHDEIHRLGLAHTHEHDHVHVSDAHDHDHAQLHVHQEAHVHAHDDAHTHDHGDGWHSHGIGPAHRHDVPDGPITLRSLVALGISGGIVPCPSALVVLLSAIALHRLGYGMLLITAFSLGLATVLVAIGILVVSARDVLDKIPSTGKAMRLLPLASAVGITVIGAVLVIQAVVSGMG